MPEKVETQTILWRAGDVGPLRSEGHNFPAFGGDSLRQRAHGQMVLTGLLADSAREHKSVLPDQQVLAAQKLFYNSSVSWITNC